PHPRPSVQGLMASLLDSGRTLLDVPRSPDGGRARRFTRESEIRDHRARGESVFPQSARFVRAPKERQRMSTISSIAMRFATVAVVCILFAPPAAAAAAPGEPTHPPRPPPASFLSGL